MAAVAYFFHFDSTPLGVGCLIILVTEIGKELGKDRENEEPTEAGE